MKNIRRLSFFVVLLAFFTLSVPACPRPHPVTDGGVSTPVSWVDTARQVSATLAWTLPALTVVVALLPIPVEIKAAIDRAIDVVRGVIPRFESAINVYITRGGGESPCEANAAAGALTDALVGIAQELGIAGWALAPEIDLLVSSLGGIADELLPACNRDAGFLRVGASYRTRLNAIPAAARARGVSLRPLPPLRRVDAGL